MSEIIVKLTDSRIKLKGGEYVRDLVRCKDCIYKEECGREVLVNQYDNDKAVDITGFLFYCSYGERADT